MRLFNKPTADQIRAYRDWEQCGFEQARRDLMRKWRQQCLEEIALREFQTVSHCVDAIRDLANILMEDNA